MHQLTCRHLFQHQLCRAGMSQCLHSIDATADHGINNKRCKHTIVEGTQLIASTLHEQTIVGLTRTL